MEFKNYTAKAHVFFEMLPSDWKDNIVPFWDDLKSTTQLFVLIENKTMIAGGLVFSKCPPDLMYYEKKANKWFEKGFLYLGFIFVDERQRNRSLGSLWLENIKKQYPKTGFWLAIEDQNLHKFYDKNGFEKVETIKNLDLQEESIYAFIP